MSDQHRQSLEMRRRELVERSAAQRSALVAGFVPLAHKAALLDRALMTVRRHPLIVAAVAGAVTLFGSKRLFSLIARGVTLYALLRKL